MDKYISGGLISGAGSFLGSGLNALSNYFTNQQNIQMAREQRAWQRAENQRAFQRDLMMWDLNNQYNSPQAQRERIEAAGGNAMLAFGNGVNVSSGNSSSYPTLDPAKSLMPELNAYTGWNLGMSDIGQAIQRQDLFKAELEGVKANTANTQADTISKMINNERAPELRDLAVEQARQLLANTIVEGELKTQLYNQNDVMNALEQEYKRNQIDLSAEELNKLREITENYRIENDFKRIEREIQKIFGPRPNGEIAEALWIYLQFAYRNQDSINKLFPNPKN